MSRERWVFRLDELLCGFWPEASQSRFSYSGHSGLSLDAQVVASPFNFDGLGELVRTLGGKDQAFRVDQNRASERGSRSANDSARRLKRITSYRMSTSEVTESLHHDLLKFLDISFLFREIILQIEDLLFDRPDTLRGDFELALHLFL